MKLQVGKRTYDIKIADTDEKRKRGLRGVKKLPTGSGLVLRWDTPKYIPIAMDGMKFPLSLVFIKDWKVQQVRHAVPDQEDIMIQEPSDQVLEVNKGDAKGIRAGASVEQFGSKQKGGVVEFVEGDIKAANGALHVLDDKGIIQHNLQGNERVFSRKDTNRLVTLSLQAQESGTVIDYRKVGRATVRAILGQDGREPEYVEEKD